MKGHLDTIKIHPTLRIYLREVLNQFSSNACISLWYVTPSTMLQGHPKSDILSAIWEFTLVAMR